MNNNSKTSNPTSLSYFQHLCNLSDRELLEMLCLGSIPILIGDKGQIMVDMKSYSIDQLGSAILESMQQKPHINPQLRQDIEETVSNEILKFLGPAIEEAIKIAKDWQKDEHISISTSQKL